MRLVGRSAFNPSSNVVLPSPSYTAATPPGPVNDRNRDADTLAAGYATVRITWERPDDAEAERLARILAARQ